MKSRYLVCNLLLGASALGLAAPAMAQSADAPAAADTAPQAANPAPSVPDIIVTGSRVIRSGAASPTPLTTISTDSLMVASPSGSISDALNTLPVFSGSRNSFSNPGSNATGVQGGNGAANVLNLRNLGATRTLVLFDGHRIPPTLYNSSVDVDLIPQELIRSVDIVTGGVSAVYGSDAVSGVVNYVLNRNFNGFQAHAEVGISQEGDAANRDFGGAFGFKVGSRGHFEASVQHRENDGILNRAYDRDWDNLAAVQGGGTTANPYYLASNVRLSNYAFGGYISSKGVLSGQHFGSNGVLSAFDRGTATGSSCCQIGGDGAYQNSSMISPFRGTQLFGRFDYDLTDDIHVYVQGAANLKKNTSYTGWNQLAGLTYSTSNAFLPEAYQDQFAAAGQSTFTMNQIWSGAPRIEALSKTRQIYLNAGIEGSLGGWKWDATYTHGMSRLKTTISNLPNAQRLAAALDAVVDPATGNIVCQASLTNPSQYGDCVPLNMFGPTASSQDALNYTLGSVEFLTHTKMDAADASISGSVFDTWAGPVNVALSAEWRKLSFDASSTATANDLADCTGLRYNCTATTTLYPTTFPNSDTVSQSVKEAAIEVEIPLLKDVAFAKSLALNAAARYTDYSTSGSYATWKVGGVWEVNNDLKFRGTISRDIRAPTLYDLFQPETVVTGSFVDTKDPNHPVTVYVPSINNGNPDLKAEVGRTYTFGAVYKPHFIPGLTLTADYYHTVVSDAITTVQGFNAAIQQACYDSNGTSPYCSLIQRDDQGNVTAFYIKPQNISKVRTWGIDGELDYNTSLAGRALGLRLLVNYQPHIYYEQPGLATIDQGDAGWGQNGLMPSPSVQIAGFVSYQVTDGVRVDLFEHYRNRFRRSGVASQVWLDPYVKSYATTNLTLTFDTGSSLKIANSSFYVSVSNLFNAKPPLSGYYSGTTSAGQSYEFSDDPTGRAFLVGFRIKG
ncbi:TonB-dependent receptor-like protein [Novosphingobium sp. PhB165]|uniref:TonB-dependent receptor domain-containing protein n=1 Tax=Novosphingobium sp. PhB165 TaxID=2485105 RepID=UPI0010504737|nr:TonB-dependent receptor [Novosphingobium sp. PhB165]TCM15388.1 TonB-dependent receptor-like protein [Novosphingobium sp. PhB165]